MKKLTLKYSFDGKDYTRTAVIKDEINIDDVLEEHPLNKDVSVECGISHVIGIWSMFFYDEDDNQTEFDFLSEPIDGDKERLTLNPGEVLIFDRACNIVNKETIPFTIELSDL